MTIYNVIKYKSNIYMYEMKHAHHDRQKYGSVQVLTSSERYQHHIE